MDRSPIILQRRKHTPLRQSLCFVCISYCTLSSVSFTPSLQKNRAIGRDHGQPCSISKTAIKLNAIPNSGPLPPNMGNKGRKKTALEATKSKLKRTTPRSSANTSTTTTGTSTTAKSKSSLQKSSTRSHNERAKRLSNIGHTSAGAWYQRDEMMQHEILTKDDENFLGRKVVKAKKIRNEMINLLERRRLEKLNDNVYGNRLLSSEEEDNEWKQMINGFDYDGIGVDFLNKQDDVEEDDDEMDFNFFDSTTQDSFMIENDYGYSTIQLDKMQNNNFKGDQRTSSTLVQDGSKLMVSSIDADLDLLSEQDVQSILNIKGGKSELRNILHGGAKARNKLMRSNIRLVVSVGKKWMSGNKDTGGISDRYNGSWNRPSLDEVIQEGMLGLARAVDKFDPDRGLRFSTYSTHWITSYVRQCFQAATTGCLKVPSQLHDIKVCSIMFVLLEFNASMTFSHILNSPIFQSPHRAHINRSSSDVLILQRLYHLKNK
jgi:DNA-directed RNA polymerase sigma subunit (sigma70/sigma32)